MKKSNLFYYIIKNKFIHNFIFRNIILLFLLLIVGVIFKINNNWNQLNHFYNFLITMFKIGLSQDNSKTLIYTWSILISLVMFIIWFLLWKNLHYTKKEFLINFFNKIPNQKIRGLLIFSVINACLLTFFITATKQNPLSIFDINKSHFSFLVLIYQIILIRIYTIKTSKLSVIFKIGIIVFMMYLMVNWKSTYKQDIWISLITLLTSIFLAWILNKKYQVQTIISHKHINTNAKFVLISWFRQNKIVALCIIPTIISIISLLYFNNKDFLIFIDKLSNKNISKEHFLILISSSIIIMQVILLTTRTIKFESKKIYFNYYDEIIYIMMLIFNFIPTIFLFFISGNEKIVLELNIYIALIFILNSVFILLKTSKLFTPIIIVIIYIMFIVFIGEKMESILNANWLHNYEKYMIWMSWIVVIIINLINYMVRKLWKK